MVLMKRSGVALAGIALLLAGCTRQGPSAEAPATPLTKRSVAVPNVVGMRARGAFALLSDDELCTGVIGTAFTRAEPNTIVTDQSPPSGSVVPALSDVNVTVALPPPSGLTTANAETLAHLGPSAVLRLRAQEQNGGCAGAGLSGSPKSSVHGAHPGAAAPLPLQGLWHPVRVDGRRTFLIQGEFTPSLRIGAHRLAFSDGCDTFDMGYVVEGRDLIVSGSGTILGTGCLGRVRAQASTLTRIVIYSLPEYSLHASRLTLSSSGGRIVFVRGG